MGRVGQDSSTRKARISHNSSPYSRPSKKQQQPIRPLESRPRVKSSGGLFSSISSLFWRKKSSESESQTSHFAGNDVPAPQTISSGSESESESDSSESDNDDEVASQLQSPERPATTATPFRHDPPSPASLPRSSVHLDGRNFGFSRTGPQRQGPSASSNDFSRPELWRRDANHYEGGAGSGPSRSHSDNLLFAPNTKLPRRGPTGGTQFHHAVTAATPIPTSPTFSPKIPPVPEMPSTPTPTPTPATPWQLPPRRMSRTPIYLGPGFSAKAIERERARKRASLLVGGGGGGGRESVGPDVQLFGASTASHPSLDELANSNMKRSTTDGDVFSLVSSKKRRLASSESQTFPPTFEDNNFPLSPSHQQQHGRRSSFQWSQPPQVVRPRPSASTSQSPALFPEQPAASSSQATAPKTLSEPSASSLPRPAKATTTATANMFLDIIREEDKKRPQKLPERALLQNPYASDDNPLSRLPKPVKKPVKPTPIRKKKNKEEEKEKHAPATRSKARETAEELLRKTMPSSVAANTQLSTPAPTRVPVLTPGDSSTLARSSDEESPSAEKDFAFSAPAVAKEKQTAVASNGFAARPTKEKRTKAVEEPAQDKPIQAFGSAPEQQDVTKSMQQKPSGSASAAAFGKPSSQDAPTSSLGANGSSSLPTGDGEDLDSKRTQALSIAKSALPHFSFGPTMSGAGEQGGHTFAEWLAVKSMTKELMPDELPAFVFA